jgi:hypothetical protein
MQSGTVFDAAAGIHGLDLAEQLEMDVAENFTELDNWSIPDRIQDTRFCRVWSGGGKHTVVSRLQCFRIRGYRAIYQVPVNQCKFSWSRNGKAANLAWLPLVSMR